MQGTLQELQTEQIRVRCEISTLYGELLKLTPASRKILNVAHDWTLRNIESLVKDLLVNIPNQIPPTNPYSEHFLMSGVNTDDLAFILDSLVHSLHNHSTLTTRIEQVSKGVA